VLWCSPSKLMMACSSFASVNVWLMASYLSGCSVGYNSLLALKTEGDYHLPFCCSALTVS
ncbi:MAG: hypothetical protein ACRCXG_04760, partial [Vibrio sp.]